MASKSTNKELRFAVLAVDTAVFAVREGKLWVLLVPVDVPPHFVGYRGLPGGLIHPAETAAEAVVRHLQVKAGLENVYVEQLSTFSRVDRDPRGRVVSVAHIGLIPPAAMKDGEGERAAQWCPVLETPRLAYDHDEILATAIERLQARLGYTTIAQHLLPEEFTLSELQEAYEVVLGREMDKRNFRKKFLALKLLKPLQRKRTGQKNRPAELYRFKKRAVDLIEIL